jgi:hypothetical protein
VPVRVFFPNGVNHMVPAATRAEVRVIEAKSEAGEAHHAHFAVLTCFADDAVLAEFRMDLLSGYELINARE